MATPGAPRPSHTIDEWLALPADARVELIDGEFVEKAAPTIQHAVAQVQTGHALAGAFARRTGGPWGPGGWWLASEVDVVLDGRGYRPDLAGWRRTTLPALPTTRPIVVRPDWLCEIVSESNRTIDTVTKLRRYHHAGVPHYWLLDHLARTLTVHRHTADGYLIVVSAEASERVRAEPFDAIELHVAVLLGDDPDDRP